MPDFWVRNFGSIWIIEPVSDAADEWVEDHIDPDHQTWAGGVVVEHRYVIDIVDGIREAGLSIG